MKKLLLAYLFIFLVSLTAKSQTIANAEGKTKVIYIGIKNPLRIEPVGYSCDVLPVNMHTGDCKATKVGDCNYHVEVTKPGSAMLHVDVRTDDGSKTVDILYFDVKYIPDPIAILGGKQTGFIPVVQLRAQIGVIAALRGFDYDARFDIVSFTTSVYRSEQKIFMNDNTGPKFDKRTSEFFRQLQSGDKLSISNVKVVGPDKNTREISGINLTMQ